MSSDQNGQAPEDEATPSEQVAMSALQAMITPERMQMPFILDQQEVVMPDGVIMCRYTLGFVNQIGQVLAAIGPNDTRIPARIVFTNDTGRRTLAQARRPRPGDIKLL